jgi:hypothetical protein
MGRNVHRGDVLLIVLYECFSLENLTSEPRARKWTAKDLPGKRGIDAPGCTLSTATESCAKDEELLSNDIGREHTLRYIRRDAPSCLERPSTTTFLT